MPVQVILIAVAMVAFNQEWHVEEERPIGDELPPVDPPSPKGAASNSTTRKARPRKSTSGRRATGRRTTGTQQEPRRNAAARPRTRRPKKA